MENQVIYIWLDFTSAFSYISFTNLWSAIKELKRNDIIVDLKTYQLDPEFDELSLDKVKEAKKEIKKTKKLMEQTRMIKVLKESGVKLNFKNIKPINTVHPHRLLQLAKTYDIEHQVANDLTRILFSKYWVGNKNISEQSELVKIAVSAGIDEKSAMSVFDTDKYLEMLFLDEQEGIDLGVDGAPCITFPNGKKILGLLTIKQAKELINEIPVYVSTGE